MNVYLIYFNSDTEQFVMTLGFPCQLEILILSSKNLSKVISLYPFDFVDGKTSDRHNFFSARHSVILEGFSFP